MMGFDATGAGLSEVSTRRLIRTALDEDLEFGADVTTLATIPPGQRSRAEVVSRQDGVVAAGAAVLWTLEELAGAGEEFSVRVAVGDGQPVAAGGVVAVVEAPTALLLTAERTLLNVLSHASGVATATARWVDAVAGTGARIRDSRKTLPGLRNLQKYAVTCGGGVNHRLALGDEALIKDNHVATVGGVTAAVTRVKERFPDLPCEVEVDTLDQLGEVFGGVLPEVVMLDNFSVADTREAVRLRDELAPSVLLESSGGLRLENARAYADCGVDFLAVGALTHSVSVLDVGLDFSPV